MRNAKASVFSPHDKEWHRIRDSKETLAARLANAHTPSVTLEWSMTSAKSPWAFFKNVFLSILVFSLFTAPFLGAFQFLVIPKAWLDASPFELWVAAFLGLLAWTAARGRAYRRRPAGFAKALL